MKKLHYLIQFTIIAVLAVGCSNKEESSVAQVEFIFGRVNYTNVIFYPDSTEAAPLSTLGLDIDENHIAIYPCVNGYFTVADNYGMIIHDNDTNARLFHHESNGENREIISGFRWIGYVNNGVFPAVRRKEPIKVYNTEGTELFTLGPVDGCQVKEVSPVYSDGLLWFRLEDNREGYFDKNGNVSLLLDPWIKVQPNVYTFSKNFFAGYVVVYGTDYFYFMNTKGELSKPIELPGNNQSVIRMKNMAYIVKGSRFNHGNAIAAYNLNGEKDDDALEALNTEFGELEYDNITSNNLKLALYIEQSRFTPFNVGWVTKLVYDNDAPDVSRSYANMENMLSFPIKSLGEAEPSDKECHIETVVTEKETVEVPAPTEDFSSRNTVALRGPVRTITEGQYRDEYDKQGEIINRYYSGHAYESRTYSSPTSYSDSEGDVKISIAGRVRKDAGPNDYERATYTFDSLGRIIKARYLEEMAYYESTYTYNDDGFLPATVTTESPYETIVEKFEYKKTDKYGNWTNARVIREITVEENEMEDEPGGTKTVTTSRTRQIKYWK